MKRFLFVCLISMVSVIHGVNYQELFLRANKHYKEHDYKKALEIYSSMPDKSSAVWYNSGNCLYHLGKYIDALVAFKRAQHGATHVQRKAIEYNIEQTRKALGVVDTPASYAQRLYEYFSYKVVPISLLWLQLLFLFFFYGLVVCVYFIRASKKYSIGVVLFGLLTLMSSALLAIKYNDIWYAHGIVVQKQGSIFVGPDKKYDASGAVTLADELSILEKRAEWYKIKKGKLLGWIPAEFVAEID